jgi:hypothetical protein
MGKIKTFAQLKLLDIKNLNKFLTVFTFFIFITKKEKK